MSRQNKQRQKAMIKASLKNSGTGQRTVKLTSKDKGVCIVVKSASTGNRTRVSYSTHKE